MTAEKRCSIAENTFKQSKSQSYFLERHLRVTATTGKAVARKRGDNFIRTVRNKLFSLFRGNKATAYGKRNEQKACAAFLEKMGRKVCNTGLQVHAVEHWLAATPDGFVDEESVVFEVKCPYMKLHLHVLLPGDESGSVDVEERP